MLLQRHLAIHNMNETVTKIDVVVEGIGEFWSEWLIFFYELNQAADMENGVWHKCDNIIVVCNL